MVFTSRLNCPYWYDPHTRTYGSDASVAETVVCTMHKRRVYRRRYKSRRSSKPKLHLKKNKKKINMVKNDFQYGGWNSYTLQCGKWLWDDTPLNSPKRPPYWNSTVHLVSISITSPQSTCHSAPVSEILSKSDHARQKKWRHIDFQNDGSRPSWILGVQ